MTNTRTSPSERRALDRAWQSAVLLMAQRVDTFAEDPSRLRFRTGISRSR